MCGTPLPPSETQVGGDTETKYTNLKKMYFVSSSRHPIPLVCLTCDECLKIVLVVVGLESEYQEKILLLSHTYGL